MDIIGNGNAPCGKCGRHIWNIPILLNTRESDGHGGFWYDVAPGGKCMDCGAQLKHLHEPALQAFNLEEKEPVEIMLEDQRFET